MPVGRLALSLVTWEICERRLGGEHVCVCAVATTSMYSQLLLLRRETISHVLGRRVMSTGGRICEWNDWETFLVSHCIYTEKKKSKNMRKSIISHQTMASCILWRLTN